VREGAMRMRMMKLSLLCAACGVATVALAAEAMPTPVDQSQAMAVAVFAALLPFAVAGIRKIAPTLPRIVVWGLPPVLGGLVAWLTNIGNLSGWQGLGVGLVAIALREFVSTLQEHGVS
jgi:hypothetical protein